MTEIDVKHRLELLKSGNKPLRPDFSGEEIFHRIPSSCPIFGRLENLNEDTLDLDVRVPDWSVSRSLDFGIAPDALLDIRETEGFVGIKDDHGVLAFPVDCLELEVKLDNQNSSAPDPFYLRLYHVPYNDNYLHSEIKIEDENGAAVTSSNRVKKIRRRYRKMVAGKFLDYIEKVAVHPNRFPVFVNVPSVPPNTTRH